MRASALDTGVSSEGQGVASYYLEASSEKRQTAVLQVVVVADAGRHAREISEHLEMQKTQTNQTA